VWFAVNFYTNSLDLYRAANAKLLTRLGKQFEVERLLESSPGWVILTDTKKCCSGDNPEAVLGHNADCKMQGHQVLGALCLSEKVTSHEICSSPFDFALSALCLYMSAFLGTRPEFYAG
jgi:hypothetical protein